MAFWASKRRACEVMQCCSSVYYYRSRRNTDQALRSRIKDVAATRVRYGYERIHVLPRREGWHVNHKKVLRIYREKGLNLRSKRPKRRVAAAHRMERPLQNTVDQCWSMDFVADNLFDGKRIRALTVVDNFSRECLAIHVDYRINGDNVVGVMNAIFQLHGRCPKRIQVDNGSEFISKALDKWAYENDVVLDFPRPGKPTDKPFIESFNGSFCDECLNSHWFLSFEDAREKIEEWSEETNDFLPHTSLENLTPIQFRDRHLKPEISSNERFSFG